MRYPAFALLPGTLFLVMACDRSPVVCIEGFRAGILVTVVDSVAGAPPVEARLIATSAGFVDSVGPGSPVQPGPGEAATLVLSTSVGRPGTYSLVVRSPGYRDWTRNVTVVTMGACDGPAVTLTARLQKP
jgi:hypothetical protein